MKRKINFNKHAGVKEFVDFNAIYNAVEKALESLDRSAEFKINNNYSVIWNDGSSEGRYIGLMYWRIDLYKNSKYENSYCLEHYFNFYVELLKGNRDIVSDIASSISNDINIKKD